MNHLVDLDVAAKRFEANGIKLLFIHDPWGANIEVNQRPHPL
jgi:hypothetical protein